MTQIKLGDIVMITPMCYSENYDGEQETYSEIVFCKAIAPIDNLYDDKRLFFQSRLNHKACSNNNHHIAPEDHNSYKYCPFCGSKLVFKKQPDEVRDFIAWHDGLEIIECPFEQLEY